MLSLEKLFFFAKKPHAIKQMEKSKEADNNLRQCCIGLYIPWPGDVDLGPPFDGPHPPVAQQACQKKAQDKK